MSVRIGNLHSRLDDLEAVAHRHPEEADGDGGDDGDDEVDHQEDEDMEGEEG